LKLEYDEALSNFAFNFNLRRCTTAALFHAAIKDIDVVIDETYHFAVKAGAYTRSR